MRAKTKAEPKGKVHAIEKNVPIPPVNQHGGYLAEAMNLLYAAEVGDSIFIENRDPGNIGQACRRIDKKNKWFTARKETRGGVSGVRVWKVEVEK